VTSRLGESSVEVPLALYAPARVHVLTDRPLYEPGNTVRFRAVVLRARDRVPLDGRPGRWLVTDPSGEVLLEEKAPAGPGAWWRGASRSTRAGQRRLEGRLGLGRRARRGAVHRRAVHPARFRVEAQTDRPFYRAGDKPLVRGAAIYSSGAPVAGAAVDVDWRVEGPWPAPTAWMLDEGGALPRHAVTGPAGRFELALPAIPPTSTAGDAGRARLGDRRRRRSRRGRRRCCCRRTPSRLGGDRARGRAGRGLQQPRLSARHHRRRRPLGGAKIRVRRAWEARDPGLDAQLDEDGVGALQLDPARR
jgi:hypothetical protein